MITKEELTTLLTTYYNEIKEDYNLEHHEEIILSIADTLMRHAEYHTMPSYTELKSSPNASDVFKDIIQDAHLKIYEKDNEIKKLHSELTIFQEKLEEIRTDIRTLPLTSCLSKINELTESLVQKKKITYSEARKFKDENAPTTYQVFSKGINQEAGVEQYKQHLNAIQWIITSFSTNNSLQLPYIPPIEHRLLDNVAQMSLLLHSERYSREAALTNGPVRIVHFFERAPTSNSINADESMSAVCESKSPSSRSSEFLLSFDSDDERHTPFEQTSHGLGSGVYGLGYLSPELINDCVQNRKAFFKIFTIERPLRLVDNDPIYESDQLTELSKYLQRVGDALKQERMTKPKPTSAFFTVRSRSDIVKEYFAKQENIIRLKEQAQILSSFTDIRAMSKSSEEMETLLIKTITEWFNEAKTSKKQLIEMPINYVIKNLNFTGIISKVNDQFNRGLIAMNELDETVQRIPVKMYSPSRPRLGTI